MWGDGRHPTTVYNLFVNSTAKQPDDFWSAQSIKKRVASVSTAITWTTFHSGSPAGNSVLCSVTKPVSMWHRSVMILLPRRNMQTFAAGAEYHTSMSLSP